MSASNLQVHSGSSSAVFLVQSVISRNWWVQNIPWYNTPERRLRRGIGHITLV